MFVESGGNSVERMESDLFDLIVLPCHRQTGCILACVFGEDYPKEVLHSYAVLMSG